MKLSLAVLIVLLHGGIVAASPTTSQLHNDTGAVASASLSRIPALAVSIALRSNMDGETKRVIDLRSKDPILDVVIQNVSNQPQEIWEEGVPDGRWGLSFEITAIDGITLPKARVVQRGGRIWSGTGNMYLPPMTLGPGETLVREAQFATYGGRANEFAVRPDGKVIIPSGGSGGDSYWGIPRPEKGDQVHISIRAVFESGKSFFGKTDKDVWEGRIVSPIVDYTVLANPDPPGQDPLDLLSSQTPSKPTAPETPTPPQPQGVPQKSDLDKIDAMVYSGA